jgi:hypothetical protein
MINMIKNNRKEVKNMKKKILTIAGAGLIMMLLPVSISAMGAAEKATGSISLFEPWDGGHRKVSLNAHESIGDRPAKGVMIDNVYGPDGSLRRTFRYDVKDVRVEGNMAYFAALATYDSEGVKDGDWLYVRVKDDGTPGTKGDYMGWKWASDESQAKAWVTGGAPTSMWRPAINGNLVVHANGN